MINQRGWTAIVISTILITGALIYGFIPRAIPADIVKASKGELTLTIEEEAKTRVRDRYVVSSPVNGYVRRILFDVGDEIKRGQALLAIEPVMPSSLDPRIRAEAEAALSGKKTSIQAAIENLNFRIAESEYAQKALLRYRSLFEAGQISRDQLDKAESTANQTEALRRASEEDVKRAHAESERTLAILGDYVRLNAGSRDIITVKAPVSGSVLKIHRESEGVVTPGEPLIDIGDPRKLEIAIEVLSTDAVRITPGTPVTFNRWGGQVPLTGIVRQVDPTGFTKISSLGVEEQRVVVVADIMSDEETWKELGDGYSLEASFIIWKGEDVLQVPTSALFRDRDQWTLFTYEDGVARLKNVEIGHNSGLVAEVLSGITEDESVIIHPDETIRDGSKIKAGPVKGSRKP